MAEKEGAIKFFSETDLTDKGKVSSTYPAWYFINMLDDLREEIRRDDRAISKGLVRPENVEETRARLERNQAKLTKIEDSMPSFTGAAKDVLAKATKELGRSISEAMFTRDDMMKGLADAHQEARRMSTPCIKLPTEAVPLARASNIRVDGNGMVSRTSAEKVWKIGRRLLGENSNTEVLRRD